jgi:hypothetical protein
VAEYPERRNLADPRGVHGPHVVDLDKLAPDDSWAVALRANEPHDALIVADLRNLSPHAVDLLHVINASRCRLPIRPDHVHKLAIRDAHRTQYPFNRATNHTTHSTTHAPAIHARAPSFPPDGAGLFIRSTSMNGPARARFIIWLVPVLAMTCVADSDAVHRIQPRPAAFRHNFPPARTASIARGGRCHPHTRTP